MKGAERRSRVGCADRRGRWRRWKCREVYEHIRFCLAFLKHIYRLVSSVPFGVVVFS